MASGSIVGEGGNEVPREKRRFLATKVYTRKYFRGHRKNVEGVAASVTPSSTEASPDVRNTEKKVLLKSGDAGVCVRETDTGAVPADECGIDTVSTSDAEKGVQKNNGDVVMEERVAEPHVNVSKGTVAESQAPQPVEAVVAEPQAFTSEKDALVEVSVAEVEACPLDEATNKVPPLQEGVGAKHVDHPSRDAIVAESPACPSDDMVAEPPARPSEDTIAEPPARPSEDMLAEALAHTSEEMVVEPPALASEDMVIELPTCPSDDTIAVPSYCSLEGTVAEPTARPSEDMVTQPTAHHLEDMVLEPPACPSVDAATGPGGDPEEDMLLIELVAPSSNGIPRKRKAAVLADATMGQQQYASLPDAPCDNFVSHNRHVEMASATGNGQQNGGLESRVRVNVSSRTRREKIEIHRKLENELAVVRGLVKRIEAKQGQLGLGRFTGLRVSVNDGGISRVSSDIGSFGVPRESTAPLRTPTPRQSRPLSQLSISVMENGQGVGESFEKEKRTPKANQFYRNSDFLLAKDKFPPAESNKKSKLNGKKHTGELGLGFGPNTKVFKSCNALLERLMKHKHGWVFNTPVDVVTLGLHDYYTIIKHPMDLGTVKSRLGRNWYKTPDEFAEDVRLTFHNAMTYNPKGQDVHFMAEQLLKIFEDKWATITSDCDQEMRFTTYHMGVRTPPPRKAPLFPVAPLDMSRILERSDSMTYTSFEARPKSMSTTPSARTPALKKPKAKDLNKRDMTYEEKQKLSTHLQSLPSEKLDNIVQIIKKRNSTLSQHDDEIEVDIDSVDAETLWELDRFVINFKKSLSKHKRKAELAMQKRAEAQQKAQEKTPAAVLVEAPKDSNTNRDEGNIPTSFPPQAEKQGDNGSRSSSSSSSSSDSGSSSSDSDSDSSSASGSDVGH